MIDWLTGDAGSAVRLAIRALMTASRCPCARLYSRERRPVAPYLGRIVHSDCGRQFCLRGYQKIRRGHDLKPSISGKGNC